MNTVEVTRGRFVDCSEADYHNDTGPVPTLNVSTAKVLNEESPKHAWLQHPRLGGHRWTPTEDVDAGTAIHSLLLGGGKLVEIDADDFRTSRARELRDAARGAGKVPIISAKLDAYRRAALHIEAALADLGIVLTGVSEQTILWTQETPGGPVACRSRLDHFKRDQAVIYDLKKIPSASPAKCERHIVEYGHDIQDAAYRRAVEAACPELVGRVRFVLLFCEIQEPYAVTPMVLDGQYRHLGERKWERAANTWGACLRSNTWPAYAERGRPLVASPPPWALAREAENAA
jgi:hypothetical protein